MLQQAVNILMTGGGAPGAAGIIRCLQQDENIRLTVGDANSNAIGKHLVHDFVTLPQANDPTFVETLLAICAQRSINIVMPLVTRELFPLAGAHERFHNAGVKVLVSKPEALSIANNKSASYQFLSNRGIDIPQFRIVKTVDEFIHAAEQLRHPGRPFCFKPSISNGSRGFRVVHDSLNESEELFRTKPYNTNISYAHAVRILGSAPFPELLVSEYLPGIEYSVDCLADHGVVKIVVPRTRTKMVNGISVEGEFVNNTALIDYCTKIIELIGLHGNIGLQVKYSLQDKPLLVEINPRVQGTIVAGLGAGINLPLLAVYQASGMSVESRQRSINWGIRFGRYWSEVFYR